MGIVLVRYKEERERGKSHPEAKGNCIWRLVGVIEAKIANELFDAKPDYKKIVTEIDALIKEFDSLDEYKDVDVTQIKTDSAPGSKRVCS